MFRSFGIVPAAGESRRMGAPKLMLPIAGRPLIEHVLAAWTASGVTRTVVVARSHDAALEEACRAFDVDVVVPAQAPADMKASVQLALRQMASRYSPSASDAWLLAPADLPGLASPVIDALVAAYDPRDPAVLVPTFGGRRGHPVLLPWSSAALVERLADGEGVNSLVSKRTVREIPWTDPAVLQDLDAPIDYARLT
jgi:molybdenum cofactor cytidylyltransferase